MTSTTSSYDQFSALLNDADTIFHYTKRNTALELILASNIFKLFPLLNTNDPREYKNRMLGASGWGWTDEIHPLITETHMCSDHILRNHSYFASFSENKFKNSSLFRHGFIKPRMWSQYGDDHFGICLAFSKKNIVKSILSTISEADYHVYGGSISYINDYEYTEADTISINGDSFTTSSPFDLAMEHINKFKNELFFKKHIDYKDEDEYRIVICRKNDTSNSIPTIDIDIQSCIVGIIVGDRFPSVHIPTISQLCESLNIGVSRLHWEKSQYILLPNLSE